MERSKYAALSLASKEVWKGLEGGRYSAKDTQFQGFADINMGKGAIVIGLAAVIIGEVAGDAIAGKKLNFAGRLSFVVVGGVLYYLTVVIVLWLRLNSNMLKFFTAVIVAVFLAIPNLTNYSKNSFSKAGRNSLKYVNGKEN